jgi:hypothetical protein
VAAVAAAPTHVLILVRVQLRKELQLKENKGDEVSRAAGSRQL